MKRRGVSMYRTFVVGTCKRYLVSLDAEVSVGEGTVVLELVEQNGLVSWVMVTLRRLVDLVYEEEPLPHFAMNKIGDAPEGATGLRAVAI